MDVVIGRAWFGCCEGGQICLDVSLNKDESESS